MHHGSAPAFALGVVGILGLGLFGCGAPATTLSSPSSIRPSSVLPLPDAREPDPSRAAVAFAEAQVGKRYCWGGTGPECFDCSGLVQAAWRSAGVKLPRTAGTQGLALEEVPLASARPGDILWWRHHVGLHVGDGLMIDAYHSRAGVVRRRVAIPQRVLRVAPTSR
jgi:cell wall-associated NlpC family hydrolase